MDLFTHANSESNENQPLAERLRPKRLEDMLGQAKLLGPKAPWRKLIESGQIPSLILWGPPGSGKTTFALLLAQKVDAEFITVNAVETGAKALRELGDEGRNRRLQYRRRTLLFIDEIHRLNKGQQDVLLPFIEKGDLILVGATTENPSYEINSALLSRARILVFERLSESELRALAERACESRATNLKNVVDPDGLDRLLEYSDGDGRRLLNLMEVLLNLYAAAGPQSRSASETNFTENPLFDDSTEEAQVNASTKMATGIDSTEDTPVHASKKATLDRVSIDEMPASGSTKVTPNHDSTEGTPANGSKGVTPDDHSSEGAQASDAVARTQGDESTEDTLDSDSKGFRFPLTAEALSKALDAPGLRYDKSADEHYDTISAFIKSVRGSDPDAAVYYLARMIQGGEDPVFIARRLVILASEDIGNADPRALTLAVSGLQAVELVGWPEAAISLAQVTTYLASAPKSNRSYMALNLAKELVEKTGTVPIPLALRSAKTASMKALGYGKGYKYSHDGEKGYVHQRFLPPELGEVKLYEPTDHGFEKNIRQYLNWLKSK